MGYLKSKFYCDPCQLSCYIRVVKKNIYREYRRIKKETVQAVIKNFNSRIQFILAKKGSWFEQILNDQKVVTVMNIEQWSTHTA